MKYYLAIDIGASSGRHILGHIENGKLCLEEIYRFDNGYIEKNGHFYWDTESLFKNVCEGIKKCKEIGKIPETLAIDTWGVDYALLDANGNIIDGVIAYRDSRTLAIMDEVYSIVSKREQYDRTGMAENSFNTVFQLYEDKKSGRIASAESILFIPCYLNYLLTGVMKNEYTFASTTGLINVKTRDWDKDIINRLGLPEKLFGKLEEPGTEVGHIKPEIAGFDCKVILPPCHDTASAVVAVPDPDGAPLYISSGTWSLFGIESKVPYTDEYAEKQGFTNEGGVNGTIRFLQNIMGLWMIQSVKRELKGKYNYQQLMEIAQNSKYEGIADVADERFLAPESMINAINGQLVELGFGAPADIADTVRAIYHGLAKAYAKAADGIENITGNKYDTIYIVGGGSKDAYLNELTAKYSGRRVVTGVTEATAIGNLAVQLIAGGEIADTRAARQLIANSFPLVEIK